MPGDTVINVKVRQTPSRTRTSELLSLFTQAFHRATGSKGEGARSGVRLQLTCTNSAIQFARLFLQYGSATWFYSMVLLCTWCSMVHGSAVWYCSMVHSLLVYI